LHQRTKGGAQVIADSSWTLTYDELGAPESVLSINTNVTERRRLEQIQLRTQRLDSLGTFASGIAHDLNNMLTPVLTAAQVLALDELDPDRLRLLESIETAAVRGGALIQQILMFGRGGEGQHITVDVDALLASVESFAQETLPKTITVAREQHDALWNLSCDQTEVLQVLFNLVANARDAMPRGGQLSIRARNATLKDGTLTQANAVNPGRFIVFSVEDTGTGMSAEVMEKIFDPFFTTKPVGSGTGLGLAASAGIVRHHGGFFQVYSEPGRGSRFDVYLPAMGSSATTNARPLETPPAPRALRGHGEVVLIVDDESEIRSVTRHALEAYGYRAAMARNGAEALEYLSAAGDAVSVILTDVMMPVMGGATLLEALARAGSTIPVVVMSGLKANHPLADDGTGAVFLPKPFETVQLLNALHTALTKEMFSGG
jgi:signal transduction histidine kinase/CheY-like chemotaxis protein